MGKQAVGGEGHSSLNLQKMSNPFKILYKYPSRNRPSRFFEGLDTITNLTADKDYYHVACTLDLDDYSMNNSDVIEKIESYPNVSIQWGSSKSKIDAVNRSMPAPAAWDL